MGWKQRLVWIIAPVSCTFIVLYILHPQSLSGRAGWWFCLVLGISFALYSWRSTLRSRLAYMVRVLDNVPVIGESFVLGGLTALPNFTPIEDTEMADSEDSLKVLSAAENSQGGV